MYTARIYSAKADYLPWRKFGGSDLRLVRGAAAGMLNGIHYGSVVGGLIAVVSFRNMPGDEERIVGYVVDGDVHASLREPEEAQADYQAPIPTELPKYEVG